MNIVLQLVQLMFGVGITGAFLWALMPRRTATEAAWARRRAEWLSVAFGLVVAYLVLVVVLRLTGPDGPNPWGIIAFLTLAAVVPVALLVLRAVWRRAISAAVAEREAASGPSAPDPQQRHRGFSGEESPPTRW